MTIFSQKKKKNSITKMSENKEEFLAENKSSTFSVWKFRGIFLFRVVLTNKINKNKKNIMATVEDGNAVGSARKREKEEIEGFVHHTVFISLSHLENKSFIFNRRSDFVLLVVDYSRA